MTDFQSENTTQTPKQTAERKIVYIREVAVDELPEEVQSQVGELKTLYAIGGEDGEQLALVRDRALAFVLARQNHMRPHSVH